jgi:hypothetical protein
VEQNMMVRWAMKYVFIGKGAILPREKSKIFAECVVFEKKSVSLRAMFN